MIWVVLVIGIFFAVAYVLVNLFGPAGIPEKEELRKSTYVYQAKNSIMTQREAGFYKLLSQAADSKWFIAPQIHLSALLNHKIKGQNWKAAFQHINGKSVDFVLLDKDTLKPVCAIELDDSTHQRTDRVARDAEVNRIFKEAGLPLVRFSDISRLTPEEIMNIIGASLSPAPTAQQ